VELSPEQLGKLRKHLKQHWQDYPQCPMCGKKKLIAYKRSFMLLDNTGKLLNKRQSVWPVVPVVCTNCGFSAFVNMIAAKLSTRNAPDPKEESGSRVNEPTTGEGGL
jgi:transcription elongation factor Elf1